VKLSLVTGWSTTIQGILNLTTSTNLFSVPLYVGYRKSHPDEKTKQEVKEKLHENNIDINQMAEWAAVNCEVPRSSSEEDISTETTEQEI
jgi:hypothetical protein